MTRRDSRETADPAARFREITHLRGEQDPDRRWFMAAELDLIVWLDDGRSPKGFQLCYDRTGVEMALTWRADRGFSHRAVDAGESALPGHKRTPVLGVTVPVDLDRLEADFLVAAVPLPLDVRRFVADKLREARKSPLPKRQEERAQDDEL